MDKIDRKILSLLQENARYPLKYLAQKVFLSSPAVSTRIERLEKAGILRLSCNDWSRCSWISYYCIYQSDFRPKTKGWVLSLCQRLSKCTWMQLCYWYIFNHVKGSLSKYNGIRHLYRTSAKIWEHTDTDCILYCCSPKRSWHRNRWPWKRIITGCSIISLSILSRDIIEYPVIRFTYDKDGCWVFGILDRSAHTEPYLSY